MTTGCSVTWGSGGQGDWGGQGAGGPGGPGRWGGQGLGGSPVQGQAEGRPGAGVRACTHTREPTENCVCVCTHGGGGCLHPSPSRKVSGLSHNNKDGGL